MKQLTDKPVTCSSLPIPFLPLNPLPFPPLPPLSIKGKGKGAVPQMGHRWGNDCMGQWGAHLPVIGCWARRWIDHWVCDAWPVQRQTYGYLPSRRASWPVPNYTAWWQRHMGVNNLPRVATQQCTSRESILQPLDHKSNALPLRYRATPLVLGPLKSS